MNHNKLFYILTLCFCGFILLLGCFIVDQIIAKRRPFLLSNSGSKFSTYHRIATLRERKINTTFEYKIYQDESEIPIDNKINFLTTDSNGMQVNPYNQTLEKTNPKSKLMIFFGGSTTECVFVQQKNRYPRLISKILTEKYNLPIRTINASVSGATTRGSIIALYAKGIPLKPKYVVLHLPLMTLLFYWLMTITGVRMPRIVL